MKLHESSLEQLSLVNHWLHLLVFDRRVCFPIAFFFLAGAPLAISRVICFKFFLIMFQARVACWWIAQGQRFQSTGDCSARDPCREAVQIWLSLTGCGAMHQQHPTCVHILNERHERMFQL